MCAYFIRGPRDANATEPICLRLVDWKKTNLYGGSTNSNNDNEQQLQMKEAKKKRLYAESKSFARMQRDFFVVAIFADILENVKHVFKGFGEKEMER